MNFFSEESLNESQNSEMSEFSEPPPQTQTEKPPPKVIAVIEANIIDPNFIEIPKCFFLMTGKN